MSATSHRGGVLVAALTAIWIAIPAEGHAAAEPSGSSAVAAVAEQWRG